MNNMQVWILFIVYVGMCIGRFPKIRLDRTGIALVGTIALIVSGRITMDEAVKAIDIPTIALLLP